MKEKAILLICVLVAILSPTTIGKIIYVDDDSTGANDGSSWQNAYIYLQDALADANSAEKPVEIRVAHGTYQPDMGAGQTAGDRESSFRLINGVTLYGGYAGVNELDPNELDYKKYETILSGDLNDDDEPDFKNYTDNSFRIVMGSFTDETAVLDGFTITAGYCHSSYESNNYLSGGVGMRIESGSPTIMNCSFINNQANHYCDGAGLLNCNGSNPTLSNCTFKDNRGGSAMENRDNSNPVLIDCVFENNRSGGGMTNNNSSPTLTNCTFNDNADTAIWHHSGSLTLFNCLFSNNIYLSFGIGAGGIENNDEMILYNCSFNNNFGTYGGGIRNSCSGTSMLYNCSFNGNTTFDSGGGINNGGYLILYNCTFSDNFTHCDGGGISSSGSSSILNVYNSVFSGNISQMNGGAIYGWGDIVNCTITSNRAKNRGGGIATETGDIIVNNTILWANTAEQGNQLALSGSCACMYVPYESPICDCHCGTISFQNSNIQDGDTGIYKEFEECKIEWLNANIDVDPCFVEPGYWDPNGTINDSDDDFWVEGDYHLKSQAGRFDPNSEEWVYDDVTSPCIDAGDPNSPIGYEPFPNGGIINMGAYGGTLEASMSPNDVNGFGLSYNPYPVDGATETGLNIILNWKSDDWPYEIYFGTSEYPPFVQKQSDGQFNPGILEPDTQYYWRIDVIDGNGDRTVGDIWKFWTSDYLIVDDFERYEEEEPDRIWETWTDGYEDPCNGSFIGYFEPDFGDLLIMEREIVHSGNQSVAFYYNYYTKNEDFSEVTVDTNDLIIGSDWLITNSETLVIWFYGDPDNPAIDQIYFKLNGAEVLYDGDSNNFLLPEWWSWEIDLDDFNLDMGYIDTMTIGIRREAPANKDGMVLIDDIRLY